MFRKVLVPVDGSPFTVEIRDYAIGFSQKLGSDLTFLYVIDVPKTTAESEVLKQKQACAKIVDDCKAKADQMGVKALSRVAVGRPGEAIVDICESEKFDLVIMGSKGYSHLRHLVIGSVADQVVNHAVCPVLVKRHIS